MKILKKYNKNMKARINKELFKLNIELKHRNAQFYGVIEDNEKLYTVYTENYGSMIIFNVISYVNIVERNIEDDGYNISFEPIIFSTGVKKDTLTKDIFNKNIKGLIDKIELVRKEKIKESNLN